MVEPIIHWEPARLRQIGFALALMGTTVLMMHPLSDMGFTDRQRLVLAATIGLTSFYSLGQYPVLTSAITIVSVALAVCVPVVLSLRVVRDTVT